MSEATIQTGVQTILQGVTGFASASIVINDWSILDKSNSGSPYVLIETADNFVSRRDTMTNNNRWDIPLFLIERFIGWEDTLNNLATHRQAIIDEFNEVGSNRSPGGGAITADVIRNEGRIVPLYDAYAVNKNEAIPIFLAQRIILEIEEF